AGTLKLGKLIGFYDDNGISIDGEVHGWFTDDTPKRFEAYGWHVVPNVDGHDPAAIERAIAAAKAEKDRPSLICCKTIIGWGAPNKQGTEATHGAALGVEEVAATRKNLGREHAPFVIPEDIRRGWDARERGQKAEDEWRARFEQERGRFTEVAGEVSRARGGIRASHARRAAGRLEDEERGVPGAGRASDRLARNSASVSAGLERTRPARAGVAGRIGGSDRVEQHEPQGFASVHR